MTEPMSLDQRRAILEREIQSYVKKGYRVLSQTDTSAQLLKPKRFSWLLAIILLILMVLPFLVYLLMYIGAKDKTVYITVDAQGKISRR